jgi:transcription initiation factor TFIID subunit 7
VKINAFYVDNRHAQLDLYGEKYRAKLVDLPCVIEAQKTFNRRHFFKVGDICQVSGVDFTRVDCLCQYH